MLERRTLDNIDIERRVQSLPPLPQLPVLPSLPSIPNPFAAASQQDLPPENITNTNILDKVDIDVEVEEEELIPNQFCNQQSGNLTLEDAAEDIPNVSLFFQILDTANITEELR